MTEVEPEFSAARRPPEIGNPADDLPLTIRIQPPYTWERRHDQATPRAVKLGTRTGSPGLWALVAGDPPAPVGHLVPDQEVADWPVQHHLEAGVAMAKIRGPLRPGRASGVQRHERGDMDLEGAFREVKDQ